MFGKIKKLFGAQDMTVGNPIGNISKFAIPLLIGNFAQQLYSTVDSVVVGKYCSIAKNGYDGVDALSAIGVSGPVVNLLLVLFIAISTGAGILVAQLYGAREKERLSHTIGTSVTLIFLTALSITIVGFFCSAPLLRLINTPEKYFAAAKAYLQIIFLGMIGGGFYNIVSGILRGLGDSFYPLVFLILSALLNIVLDIWFVAGLGLGVAGAAWATIIAQAISGTLCIVRLNHMKDIVVLSPKVLKPNGRLMREVLRLGLPGGISQAVFSLAMVIVQSLTNRMGDFVPAISVAVMRVDGFAMMPNFTFGLAISTYIGQNLGAKRRDRLEPGKNAALKLAMACSFVLVGLLIFFGKYLIELFISEGNTTPEVYTNVVSLGGRALRILAAGYIAMGFTQVYSGILRAAGDTMSTMYISLITTVAIRVPLAYGIAAMTKSDSWPVGHPDALFISLLVSWVLNAVLTYLRYRQGKWRKIDLVGRT